MPACSAVSFAHNSTKLTLIEGYAILKTFFLCPVKFAKKQLQYTL